MQVSVQVVRFLYLKKICARQQRQIYCHQQWHARYCCFARDLFHSRTSSTDSETEEIMYAVHSSDDRIIRDEARESETECDRLCK